MSWKSWCARAAFGLPAFVALSGAGAQAREPRLTFGITGGAAKGPQEPFRTGTLGYNVSASMELRTPVRQLRLRSEAMFADWQSNQVMALTGTVVVTPLPERAVEPYLLAGAGGYKSPDQAMLEGWNLGAGLKFDVGGRKLFLESRIHAFRIAEGIPVNLPARGSLGRDWRNVYTPISLGIAF